MKGINQPPVHWRFQIARGMAEDYQEDCDGFCDVDQFDSRLFFFSLKG
jgi:hypothetical protein